MQVYLVACQRLHLLAISHLLRRAPGIQQLKLLALSHQRAQHGKNRRDTNSAGNQQSMPGMATQREVVDRVRDFELRAHLKAVMYALRAALAVFSLHRNSVAVEVIVFQRRRTHQ